MTTNQDALRMALEAMEEAARVIEALKPAEYGNGTIVRLRRAHAALSAPLPKEALEDQEEMRESLREAVAGSLNSTYVCGRVWSAWQVGTMTEDDFVPFSDCEEAIDAVVDAAITAIRSLQAQG